MGAATDYTAMSGAELFFLFHKLCQKEVSLCNNFLQLWDKLRESLGVQNDNQINKVILSHLNYLCQQLLEEKHELRHVRHVHSMKGLRSRWQPCRWVTERTDCSSHHTKTGGTSRNKDEGKAVRDRSKAGKIQYHICYNTPILVMQTFKTAQSAKPRYV